MLTLDALALHEGSPGGQTKPDDGFMTDLIHLAARRKWTTLSSQQSAAGPGEQVLRCQIVDQLPKEKAEAYIGIQVPNLIYLHPKTLLAGSQLLCLIPTYA